jgi:hypothetical protein
VPSAVTSSPMAEDVVDAACALISAVSSGGGDARVLGGIAVALRCPSARRPGPFARDYSDIDLVTSKRSSAVLSEVLTAQGYLPEERFNALHGHSRMMFAHPGGVHVDVFVEEFNMCHRLVLGPRLGVHETTVSLSDLMLTKLQVAELNAKDVTDAAALLLDHDLRADERGINVPYITELLRADWGWWRTVTHNLRALPGHLDRQAVGGDPQRIAGAAEALLAEIDAAPKTRRWKLRAKAGDRIAWREDPEESH